MSYLCSLNEYKFDSVKNIIQVINSIPWVRCASGNVFLDFWPYFWNENSYRRSALVRTNRFLGDFFRFFGFLDFFGFSIGFLAKFQAWPGQRPCMRVPLFKLCSSRRPPACVHDACIHDASIHDAFIHGACINYKCMHDACASSGVYCIVHACLMRLLMMHVWIWIWIWLIWMMKMAET